MNAPTKVDVSAKAKTFYDKFKSFNVQLPPADKLDAPQKNGSSHADVLRAMQTVHGAVKDFRSKNSNLPKVSLREVLKVENAITTEMLNKLLMLALTNISYFYEIFCNNSVRAALILALENEQERINLSDGLKLFCRAYGVKQKYFLEKLKDNDFKDQQAKQHLFNLLPNDQVAKEIRLQIFYSFWAQATDKEKPDVIAATAADKKGNVISALNLHQFDDSSKAKTKRPVVSAGSANFLTYITKNPPAAAAAVRRDHPDGLDEAQVAELSKQELKAVKIANHILNKSHARLDQHKKNTVAVKSKIELGKAHATLAYRVLANRALNHDVTSANAAALIAAHPESKDVVDRVFQRNWFVGKNYSLSPADLVVAAKSSALAREKILADRYLCLQLLSATPNELEGLEDFHKPFGNKDTGFMESVVNTVMDRGFFQSDYFARFTSNQLAFLAAYHKRVREKVLVDPKLMVLSLKADIEVIKKAHDHNVLSGIVEKLLTPANPNRANVVGDIGADQLAFLAEKHFGVRNIILDNPGLCLTLLKARIDLVRDLNTHHKDFLSSVIEKCCLNKKDVVLLDVGLAAFLVVHDLLPKHISVQRVCVDILNDYKHLDVLHEDHEELLEQMFIKALGSAKKDNKQVNSKVLNSDTLLFLVSNYPTMQERVLAKRRLCIEILRNDPAQLKILNEEAPQFLDEILKIVFAKETLFERINPAVLASSPLREKILANVEYCEVIFHAELQLHLNLKTKHQPFLDEILEKLCTVNAPNLSYLNAIKQNVTPAQFSALLLVAMEVSRILNLIRQEYNKKFEGENSGGQKSDRDFTLKDAIEVASMYEEENKYKELYGKQLCEQADVLVKLTAEVPAIKDAISHYEPLGWLLMQATDAQELEKASAQNEKPKDEKSAKKVLLKPYKEPASNVASIVVDEKVKADCKKVLDAKNAKVVAEFCEEDEEQDKKIKTAMEQSVERHAESARECRVKNYVAINVRYFSMPNPDSAKQKPKRIAFEDESKPAVALRATH